MSTQEPPASDAVVTARVHAELDLVEAIARQLSRHMGGLVELDELRSAGREGLMLAAKRFEPERGIPFAGYASFRVRGAMLDAVRRAGPLPRRVHQQLSAMEAGARFSEAALEDGVAPPPGETRADAQRSLDEHLAGMATAMAMGMVAERAMDDAGEPVGRDSALSPEDRVEKAQLLRLLEEGIAELPVQEALLVRRHYFEGARFDHVAAELGLSKSWASRLHSRAVARLTKRLRARL